MAVAGIEQTLLSIHDMLAAFMKLPELALKPEEAAALAGAIANVNRYYRLPVLRPEHAALLALAGTAGAIYRPRVQAVLARKMARRAQPPAEGAAVNGADMGAGTGIPGPATAPAAPWFPTSLQ